MFKILLDKIVSFFRSLKRRDTARLLPLALTLILPLCLVGLHILDHHTASPGSNVNASPLANISSPDPTGSPPNHHLGIDISHYQGDLMSNLNHHSGLAFVICKATEGITYVDPDFSSNWQAIQEKGLIRGTYHFYIATDDPIKQAKHFYEVVGKLERDDIAPIIDVEALGVPSTVSATELEAGLKLFIQRIEKAFGRRPIIYSNFDFAQTYLTDDWLSDYPLWIAEYTSRGYPRVPTAWHKTGYKLWQRSDQYTVDSMDTDLDVFVGHKSDLVN